MVTCYSKEKYDAYLFHGSLCSSSKTAENQYELFLSFLLLPAPESTKVLGEV